MFEPQVTAEVKEEDPLKQEDNIAATIDPVHVPTIKQDPEGTPSKEYQQATPIASINKQEHHPLAGRHSKPHGAKPLFSFPSKQTMYSPFLVLFFSDLLICVCSTE